MDKNASKLIEVMFQRKLKSKKDTMTSVVIYKPCMIGRTSFKIGVALKSAVLLALL